MSAADPHHALRRALVGGYRVADVEVALAQLDLALAHARIDLDSAERRLAVLERVGAEQRACLEEARQAANQSAQTQLELEREHDEATRAAQQRIESAGAAAARDRETVERLQITHERLAHTVRQLTRDFDEPTAAPEPTPAAAPVLAFPPQAIRATAVTGTDVELDAGPFNDLASLTAFERSLAELPPVAAVYIRRYEAKRATLELQLHQPSDLIQEMTTRLPYRLDVATADSDRISVTVFPEALPA